MSETPEELSFDPDLPPNSNHNQEVARKLKFTFDIFSGCWLDEDGCLVRDEFGQRM